MGCVREVMLFLFRQALIHCEEPRPLKAAVHLAGTVSSAPRAAHFSPIMSAITHSQAIRTASEVAATASLPAESEVTTNTRLQNGPTSAIAIEVLHGRLGCALFLEEEQQLLLCEDLPCDFAFDNRDAVSTAHIAGPNNEVAGAEGVPIAAESDNVAVGHPSYGYVGSLLSQFGPDLLVVSARCPESLLDMLRHYAEQHNSVMEVRPAKYFQMSIGLSSLEDITSFSRAHDSTQDESMSALVVLEARVATSRSALSVRMKTIDHRRLELLLKRPPVDSVTACCAQIASVGPLVSTLRARCEVGRTIALVPLCLDNHLFLDDNTFKSLSICSSDVHGFVHAKQGREGFSILAMMSLTCSKYSQPLLRRWLMLPLAQHSEVLRRHEAVELLVHLESASDTIRIRSQLTELGGVPQLCYKLNMGVGSASTWSWLFKTCNAIINIRAELNGLDLSKSELLNEVAVDSLQQLADAIGNTIDFELSKEQGKVTVRSGVDTHLDELREQQVRLPGQLDRVAADLRTEAAFRPTRTLHVVYFPQIGYLICVPGGEMIDMQADPTLEQQFASEDCVYLKNSRMSYLDNSFGDVASFIVDKEIEILDRLQTLLQECTPVLLAAHAALAQIDWAATLYDLKRPTLVAEQVVKLKGSRHALKALSDESFVPNDIELRGGLGLPVEDAEMPVGELVAQPTGNQGQPRPASQAAAARDAVKFEGQRSILVLTGANSSGKSCLLQQAGLAIYLSQCGSFVPAQSAELGVFDKILTRMRQDESVASEGSSFTRELGRLHRALAMSTRRSLVLLDEVGRECRSDDGAGLFISTIYEFLQRGPDCPIVLSATHHLRAIERHLPSTLPIQRAHMQTLLLPTLASTYNSLTYLYRLRPGFAETSHACHCARLCGVPESVVERADRIACAGLRAWNDAEAVRDEEVVRRLMQLQLGNGEEEEREVDDEAAKRMLRWVLQGDPVDGEEVSRAVMQVVEE
ncbi:MutS-like protein [Pseudozyma hubeiensis]|nr:MutS-like protein [Pseudozyma hubeiensis]